jgi:hypothetical protein
MLIGDTSSMCHTPGTVLHIYTLRTSIMWVYWYNYFMGINNTYCILGILLYRYTHIGIPIYHWYIRTSRTSTLVHWYTDTMVRIHIMFVH